ncbi:NepR family anti-sigma factor [Rhizobium herbae]
MPRSPITVLILITGAAWRAGTRTSDPNTRIASKLKALYSAIEQEPIPDTFLDLLERLDRAEQLGKPQS